MRTTIHPGWVSGLGAAAANLGIVQTFTAVSLKAHRVVQVSCGAAHTVVVDTNGFVSGCGWNEWGQASGRMNCTSVWHLTPVRFKGPFSAIRVACGLGHSIAVDSNGNAKSWGFGEDGQLGFGREEHLEKEQLPGPSSEALGLLE